MTNILTMQEKHYKLLREVMTEMFTQTGLLSPAEIIELDNYHDFLKVLQHHRFMGNLSTTQLTHFLMLMVYMSFCRLNHYTTYMERREAVLLKAAIWMSLVVISFKTTFSIKGSDHSINPYFNNLPSMVRKYVHAITTKYMEQECIYPNHVLCDISPVPLTTDIVLPSYDHFLNFFSAIRCDLQRIQYVNPIWQDNSDVDLSQSEWILQSIHPSYYHAGRRPCSKCHVWLHPTDY